MSPRPYRLGLRQPATEKTRARIIHAARELIMSGGLVAFTIDAVARRAGVARMTVYYQFGSKRGLLEALFDDLASRGGMERVAAAMQKEDALEALDTLIGTFCRFWASDRDVIRRLRAWGQLDRELGESLRDRDERRRHLLRVITQRVAGTAPEQLRMESVDTVVDTLHVLTSFETFDGLADGTRGPVEVASLVQSLARAALRLGES